MYIPFEEMTWSQFISQPHLKRLSLQEQANYYNQYLFELSMARQNWIETQSKGPRGIVNVGLLAQEEFNTPDNDYFLILQEDGFGIFVTQYVY